ncbi:MAG TPA: enoyl-ACP reductase [Bacillota bacterium]
MGVANQRSFASAVAVSAARHGARVAVTYQNERLADRAAALAQQIPLAGTYACDVSDDDSIARCFEQVAAALGRLDFLVHSIAYARKEDLDGRFVDTSRDGFLLAHDISAYSLIAVARAARPLMAGGGSIITLTYLGSTRVFTNYNVMGSAKAALESSMRYLAGDLGPENIRVNAISAGPVKTLAASAVRGLHRIREVVEERAPLRRNIEPADVGDAAVFLASDLSRSITGQVLFVDSGYHIMGF